MQDFTEGSIGKHVINFGTPLMLGNLLLSFYGIINLIWVGRLLGHKAVAAVSPSGMWTYPSTPKTDPRIAPAIKTKMQ